MSEREIIFKAISIETGEWVEGDLIQLGEHKFIKIDKNCTYINVDMFGNNCKLRFNDEVTAVDPKKVCQFTGHFDKNKDMIFEGDILDGTKEVYWNEHTYAINDRSSHASFTYFPAVYKMTITGSIHTPKEQDNE